MHVPCDVPVSFHFLKVFGKHPLCHFLDALAPFRLTVYGPATPGLQDAMQGFNAVHFEPLGGFCR